MRKSDGTEALDRSRQLRRSSTPHEKRLWGALRDRRLADAKFRRQVWIGPFIADFLCAEAKLIVEVDGSQHGEAAAYDEARSVYLAEHGYRVLRVWNNDVDGDFESVLTAIRAVLRDTVPSPSHSAAPSGALPLPKGRGV